MYQLDRVGRFKRKQITLCVMQMDFVIWTSITSDYLIHLSGRLELGSIIPVDSSPDNSYDFHRVDFYQRFRFETLHLGPVSSVTTALQFHFIQRLPSY